MQQARLDLKEEKKVLVEQQCVCDDVEEEKGALCENAIIQAIVVGGKTKERLELSFLFQKCNAGHNIE